MKVKDELKVIGKIRTELERLSPSARERVMRYIMALDIETQDWPLDLNREQTVGTNDETANSSPSTRYL